MRKIISPIVAAVALAVPVAASAGNAGSVSQEGFIDGDKAASVKLRVALSASGAPQKVGGFRAKNVLAHCDKDKLIRIQLTALQAVDVDADQRFKVRLPDGEGGILRISGRVGDGGRATSGTVKTNEFSSGELTCKVAKQHFATSAD